MRAKKILFCALAVLLIISMLPVSALAAIDFDTSVSGDYFNVISQDEYALAPGATETEMVLNNASGSDRKVVHVFEVDTTNENIAVLPGYYGIDKLNPDDLAGDSAIWSDGALSKTVKYYEDVLGYNVVGAMNTALAYDSNAPYGYMVWDGVVLGTPEIHKGAQTYLAIDAQGNCELRSMSTPLNGTEVTAISANFGWLVKDGVLQTKTVERTSSDASRSMIGIKADGTLVFCQVDGRNAPTSTGLSNYEMGEVMLSMGCVNAVNCDGGGSSTFISKREGESENVMRSVPSDGSERPTINSVIIVSKAMATGIFDHAVLESEYDYYAPGSSATMIASGVDTNGYPVDVPAEGISWKLADDTFGTVADGKFTSTGKLGDVAVQMVYGNQVVGEKILHIVHPQVFALTLDDTVLPYGKGMDIEFACTYGSDAWAVCVEGAYALTLSDAAAATLTGNSLVATKDETIKGVTVTATYLANPAVTDVLEVTFGKGSEIIYDFEDGDLAGFMGFKEAKQWSIDNGVSNSLILGPNEKFPGQTSAGPLAGQFNEQISSTTFMADAQNGDPVRNGRHALAWSLDNTDADFAGWSYNVLFNVGETIVLRDVANGKNATTLGMWLYIPEGATGLAFQSQLYVKNADGSYSCKQDHFMFTTNSGVKKNLNSCTEADIPESRWVYASIDISKYDYLCTPVATDKTNARSPSFIRTYVKPTTAAVHTFYIDDITLDYSSAVDDRVLPVISNVSYTTADESVTLDDGATIEGNSVAFSAVVADNVKLDNASGKIYVDGNVLPNATVSGKYLASDAVVLTSGAHTVTYEIKDVLGNTALVTRTFTVAGDAAITLAGHNDSGALPEYDSVYYVDVNVADIANINKVTTTLKLQTANKWEPQGMSVAGGFKVTYALNTTKDELTLTIERNGMTVDAAAASLVSIPVRLWSWDGVNNVTETPIAPETQFETGYCPIIKVDCKVLVGTVEFAKSNFFGAFGGQISVETKLNDNVNPWHYHDAKLTVLNKDATCTTDGYTGRTYCETCKSVIEWGTITAATGHNYQLVDNALKCVCGEGFTGTWTDGKDYIDGMPLENGWYGKYYYVNGAKVTGLCVIDGVYYNFSETGESKGKYTGLFEKDGKTYYIIGGNMVKGWQLIGDSWYHFNTSSGAGYNGNYSQAYFGYSDKLTFTFENGKLLSGEWSETADGYRYYYGPSYYKRTWTEIDGEQYYFDKNGHRLAGYQLISPNLNDKTPVYELYFFAEDGKLVKKYDEDGLNQVNGSLYYIVDGKVVYSQLVKIGDAYYCFGETGKAIVGQSCYITVKVANGLIEPGTYTFDDEGKMVFDAAKEGFHVDNKGVLRYYVGGKVQYGLGLVHIDGYYYYINNSGVVATGEYYLSSGWTQNRLPSATYYFGQDGKLELNAGTIEQDGATKYYAFVSDSSGLHYYVNAKKQYGLGLMEIDGDYYYVNNQGVVATGEYYLNSGWTKNRLPSATYFFGDDGRLTTEVGKYEENGVVNYYVFLADGEGLHCYLNARKQYGLGLVTIGGSRYYINNKGVVATDIYYLRGSWTNYELPDGYYDFGADGKLRVNDGYVNGQHYVFVYSDEEQTVLHYYVNSKKQYGLGLVTVNGDRYYVNSKGVVATGEYYLNSSWVNYQLPSGTYTFGADGKLILG